MDFKGFVILLLAFGAAAGQENPLPDIMDRIFHLHNQYEGFKDTMRLTMGVLGRDLSARVVGVLTDEIASWQRRLFLKCRPTALNTEAAGEILRVCSRDASDEFQQLQANVFDALEIMHHTSNEISLRITRELAEFNIVLNYDEFGAHFDPIVTVYEAQLDQYVYDIGMKLAQFIVTGDDLPERTQECIVAAQAPEFARNSIDTGLSLLRQSTFSLKDGLKCILQAWHKVMLKTIISHIHDRLEVLHEIRIVLKNIEVAQMAHNGKLQLHRFLLHCFQLIVDIIVDVVDCLTGLHGTIPQSIPNSLRIAW
uniref:Putative conserved secreted protein n=1 Tax=Lutzomyia longipalpis TaxID=7200 RepID=A0A1B0EW82_LUTLO